MFFSKNKDKTNKNDDLVKIAALLIHAAKIDENYTDKEQEIIKQVLFELGADKGNIKNILEDGKKIEENSNQILDFTKEIKNSSMETKIKIIETLWQIIYSNNDADMYETNLMRRLAGLLYIEDKIVGDIKNKVKGEKI
ncbi:MAG: TerB family tellurite resistance protein [Candidatus Pelagibacter sp.]